MLRAMLFLPEAPATQGIGSGHAPVPPIQAAHGPRACGGSGEGGSGGVGEGQPMDRVGYGLGSRSASGAAEQPQRAAQLQAAQSWAPPGGVFAAGWNAALRSALAAPSLLTALQEVHDCGAAKPQQSAFCASLLGLAELCWQCLAQQGPPGGTHLCLVLGRVMFFCLLCFHSCGSWNFPCIRLGSFLHPCLLFTPPAGLAEPRDLAQVAQLAVLGRTGDAGVLCAADLEVAVAEVAASQRTLVSPGGLAETGLHLLQQGVLGAHGEAANHRSCVLPKDGCRFLHEYNYNDIQSTTPSKRSDIPLAYK